MQLARRRVRNYVLGYIGVQGNMQIWWTPQIPIIYVGNPKAGCSSIKQSLKSAQARQYERSGRSFTRIVDPHTDDDCLRRKGLAPSNCRNRYVFSCVRNPLARVLSAYLDKVVAGDHRNYPELRNLRSVTFESFLRAIADHDPLLLDVHFRPQHINLNYPIVSYDAVFYLENAEPMASFLEQIVPEFEFARFSPHARSAQQKLAEHFDPVTIGLVHRIYSRDFTYFGYSRKLEDALDAPGRMLSEHTLLPQDAEQPPPPCPKRPTRNMAPLEKTLRCRWLIERHLI